MNTFTRKSVLTVSAGFAVALLVAVSANAAPPQALLLHPDSHPHFPHYELPKFGFSSFSINGYGERVTHVRWGGLASRLGLEPGDTILRMNDVPLTYHGSWNDALRHVMDEHGGVVRLRIRDVRTGHVTFREMFVGGGHGPITPKYHVGNGPVTHKSMHGGNQNKKFNNNIKKLAELLD